MNLFQVYKMTFFRWINVVKLMTVVEGDPTAPISIATTSRC